MIVNTINTAIHFHLTESRRLSSPTHIPGWHTPAY